MSYIINPYSFGVQLPTGNLLVYLKFNGNTTDSQGNISPTASLTYGNGLYDGISNGAAQLSTTQYVANVADADINFGDGSTDETFSISFTYNLSSFDSGDPPYLFNKRNFSASSDVSSSPLEYGAQLQSTGEILFFVQDNSVTGGRLGIVTTSAFNTTSTNYHVVCTYDASGTEGGLTIYVDGSSQSTTSGSGSGSASYVAMENTGVHLCLGRRSWRGATSPTGSLEGRMDNFGVWDKELTSTEVTDIYNHESSGNDIV